MKKYILVLNLFALVTLQVFSQCDSVQVAMHFYSGDTDDNASKTVSHYDSSRNLISYEYYDNSYPDNKWERYSRRFYTYDANENLKSQLSQSGNDTCWVNTQRNLFSYNSSGSNTSKTLQNRIINAWITYSADSTEMFRDLFFVISTISFRISNNSKAL